MKFYWNTVNQCLSICGRNERNTTLYVNTLKCEYIIIRITFLFNMYHYTIIIQCFEKDKVEIQMVENAILKIKII